MHPFLTHEPIDASALTNRVAGTAHGALATFAGLVRDNHQGRSVRALHYSAYETMASAAMGELVQEAATRFNVAIAVQHRLGDLEIGDLAVFVAVGAGHREQAFQACRWVIDALKERVPIWKRERYDDGTESWVDPTAPAGAVAARPRPAEQLE